MLSVDRNTSKFKHNDGNPKWIVYWVFYWNVNTMYPDSGYKLTPAQSVCTRPFFLAWGYEATCKYKREREREGEGDASVPTPINYGNGSM